MSTQRDDEERAHTKALVDREAAKIVAEMNSGSAAGEWLTDPLPVTFGARVPRGDGTYIEWPLDPNDESRDVGLSEFLNRPEPTK